MTCTAWAGSKLHCGAAAALTYHVVPGPVKASDVMGVDGQSVKTVNGAALTISTKVGVKLNGSAKVVKTDIECSNGIVHVIDSVLIPQ